MLTDWHGCYDDSWRGIIVSESFAHPAKMARGLLHRIVNRMLDDGWLRKGDIVGDPFGGIGTTGIMCSYHGLRSVSVELEPHFCDFARQNFAEHTRDWRYLGEPLPTVIQGDSRKFAALVPSLDGVITSPPYAECVKGAHGEQETAQESRDARQTPGGSLGQSQRHGGYGVSEWQIGALKDAGLNKVTSYWYAVREVYRQMLAVMKPGAVAAVVVKDYVKGRRRMPVADETAALLATVGFDVFEVTRCHVTKKLQAQLRLDGSLDKRTKDRKSFFRRIAEKRGSPPIDWECVIWCRKQQGAE